MSVSVECNDKFSAFFQFTGKFNPAIHYLNVAAYNVQAQPGALDVNYIGATEKTFKKVLLVLLGYAKPVIFYLKDDFIFCGSAGNFYDTVIRREFNSIRQQIGDYIPQQNRIQFQRFITEVLIPYLLFVFCYALQFGTK
jgi:hypothetical protein